MRARYTFSTLGLETGMIVAAIVYAFPLYVLLELSFRPERAIASSPLGLPEFGYLKNYADAWQHASLGSAMLNSIIVTTASVAILVFLGSAASYVLARSTSRIGAVLFALFIVGIIVPYELGLLPLYRLIRDMGLLGTRFSLVLFYGGRFLPLVVFLYTGFIRSLPREYEEAALVDGASHLQVFTRVVFPLLRPVTGTVIIVTTVFIWNDFLTPLLYLGGSGKATIPLAIYKFVGQYQSRWGLVFAGLVAGSIPILALYFLLQRHVIRGFASGLKG